MTKFLFAWELGANYGHLARDLAVAQRLRTAGHQVIFAVSDTRIAAELLTRQRFSFVQVPVLRATAKLSRPPANYAEMLLAENWGDRLSLHGLTEAWLHLYDLVRPDVVVADHAPTALLASRIARIPSAAMGSGFEIPPALHPLPSIRPWEDIPNDLIAQSERFLLDCINFVCNALGGSPLYHVADLLPPQPILTTFSELDHFGPRDAGTYVGSIHGLSIGENVLWHRGRRSRILVYLRRHQHATQSVLEVLSGMDTHAICIVPGVDKHFTQKHMNSKVSIQSRPVQLSQLVADADVLVCYGSAGIIAQALLAGVPLLMIPETVEQYLAATRVAMLGAGIVVENRTGRDAVQSALKKLISMPHYREAARQFAARYFHVTPDHAADEAAAILKNFSRLSGLEMSGSTKRNSIRSGN